VDARLFRYPDVSATQIAFTYGGDIWVVPKTGGTATRLSSPRGEETWPRFSPDGTRLAFSGNYEGNTDLYVMPVTGGEPTRITHHPMPDRLMDWYPDGKSLLFASQMQSERARYYQLHRVGAAGGLPERLPTKIAEYGAISPDGKTLAFMPYPPMAGSPRDWKGYRGGSAPDIWLFDLTSFASVNVTNSPANDAYPMWHGRTLYFLSDRDERTRYNIWAYDLDKKTLRQVTHLTEDDITFPAIGPSDIVFQAGGRLFLLDLATEAVKEVRVQVVADFASLRPRTEKVANLIQNGWLSPTGQRTVFEARGELFSVPAENGPVIDLTRSSGVAERSPTWSPDGRQLAYWSDRTGEYELYLRPADGSGSERKVTSYGPGFRYRPYWSPDGKRIAFIDQTMTIRILELETGKTLEVDQGEYLNEDKLAAFAPSWSPDGRWLAYTRDRGPNVRPGANGAIQLFDTRSGQRHQVTSGYYSDYQPAFDPDGKYLFFLSSRTLAPIYGDLDNTWIYANTSNVVAVPLRANVPSPVAPRNDVESPVKDTTRAGGPVEIDLADFERRVVLLPPKPGNYASLVAVPGKLLYFRRPRTGAAPGERSALVSYDLKDRTEQTIVDDADAFLPSADGKRVLVSANRRFAVVDVKPGQKLDKPLRVDEMEMTVDPPAEWRQMVTEVGRLYRDYFYDRTLHGVDWNGIRARYAKLLDGAVTRWDVDFIIGELIGELRSGHTYRSGGDVEASTQRNVGLLGVDWNLENGAYRIKRIVDGGPWDSEVRSPVARAGTIKAGDYVLAVNGSPLDPTQDPWAGFQGLAGKTVELTVNDRPTVEGSRRVLVEPLADETRLRHLEWVESNRKRVEEATGGRIGYIYVPSTGIDGQTELVRQFRAQFEKDGLVVDERWNTGGQIPDRFIEILNRPALAFWAVRDGKDWRWPPGGNFGPKVMLINGWSGSGGDAFPFYFKEAKLGPLIGQRTWGALIGLSNNPTLIDGGAVTVPTFRMYSVRGEWFPEGHGVDPDIQVVDDPTERARGRDPELERGISEVLELLKRQPPTTPKRPAWEDRRAKAGPPPP
jgi:tricorn protease